MCTVTVSAPGSGIVRSFSPFASCHSVIPSMLWAFRGTSAAPAAPTKAKRTAKKKSLMPATATAAAGSCSFRTGRKLRLAAVLADAGPMFFALLVLARFADLLALRRGFLEARFALRRVLRLRAGLAPHAFAPLVALLRFAGLAHPRNRFQSAFAGLRILRLRAHLAPHARALVGRGLALAGLLRPGMRCLRLRYALLAGLRVLGLGAVEALRRLGVDERAGGEQGTAGKN